MSELKPCPFCGNTEPEFERIGTPRQSCIVVCGNCGARHESSDEGEDSGASWNRRAQPAQAVPSDVVRDAAPIPDHELVTMYDERPTSDLEMIEFAREVERRHGIGVQPQHITDGSPCWCNPDVAYTDPETGASVIVHRRPQ